MSRMSWISLVLVFSVGAQAQLIFNALDTPQTVTFDAAVSNLLSYHATNHFGTIRETYTALLTDFWALRSLSWSVRASGINIAGNGAGNWTPFAVEIEVPPDSSEDHFVVSDFRVARHAAFSGGTAVRTAVLSTGNSGLAMGPESAAPWRDFGATLRAQNNTGQTATGFKYSLDAWYGDPDTNYSNLVLSYSTDNVTYTPITTLNGYRTTTQAFDFSNINHWSSNFSPSGQVNVTIPNGGYLYFRIESLRPSGSSGGTWIMDNVQLELIPEPGTVGLLMAAVPLVWMRRRISAIQAR